MPDIVWSVVGFIVAMSVLVCFHEFGHYWVARRMGVKVLRFSLGWGKPFKTFVTRDGVEWSIAPLPIGGYVKMLDEREGPVRPGCATWHSTTSQSPSARDRRGGPGVQLCAGDRALLAGVHRRRTGTHHRLPIERLRLPRAHRG